MAKFSKNLAHGWVGKKQYFTIEVAKEHLERKIKNVFL